MFIHAVVDGFKLSHLLIYRKFLFSFVQAIDIIVYFPDKTGVQLKVRDGQNIEAGELFELVMSVMKFPAEARESFSLWLVSDLLGTITCCFIN